MATTRHHFRPIQPHRALPRPGAGPGTLARHAHAYLFIAPFFLLFAVFMLFPILFSFALSFQRWNGILPGAWVGAGNYIRAFGDPLFLRAAANTAIFALLSVSLTTAGALALAVMLNSVRSLRLFFRGVFFLPSVVSLVIVSVVWKILLHSEIGMLPETLSVLGGWFSSVLGATPSWWPQPGSVRLLDSTAHVPGIPAASVPLLTLVFINLWAGVGFSTVIYLAGLQSIPTQLYEAAIMDGAGRGECFRHITLPMLRPTTYFVVLMGTIDALQTFVLPNVMARDSEATMSVVYFMYRQAFEYQRMGYASALAYILFFITVLLGLAVHHWLGRAAEDNRIAAD